MHMFYEKIFVSNLYVLHNSDDSNDGTGQDHINEDISEKVKQRSLTFKCNISINATKYAITDEFKKGTLSYKYWKTILCSELRH